MLLAESEPSKIRRRLADFSDAAIDAQLPEATRLAETIQTLWPAILVRLPRTPPTPAPRASTGSSNKPSGSAAAIAT